MRGSRKASAGAGEANGNVAGNRDTPFPGSREKYWEVCRKFCLSLQSWGRKPLCFELLMREGPRDARTQEQGIPKKLNRELKSLLRNRRFAGWLRADDWSAAPTLRPWPA